MEGERITALISCFKVAIILYITYKGYLVLAGKTQEPIRDLLWNGLSKVLIIGIIDNYAWWAKEVVAPFVNGLQGWAYGGMSLANMIEIADSTINTAVPIDTPFWSTDTVLYPFLVVAKWISMGIGFGIPIFTLEIIRITLQFLILIAPIAIWCKIFGFLKNSFNQWVQLLLANILTVLFVSFVMSYGLNIMFGLTEAMRNKVYVGNNSELIFTMVIAVILLLVYIKHRLFPSKQTEETEEQIQ
jgi:type IV secretion system protein VirB6